MDHFTEGDPDNPSGFAAGYERTLHHSDISALREGDCFKDGHLYDVEGHEVPVLDKHDAHPAEVPRRNTLTEH